jgi:predicted nucleic acid-binding protein
MSDFILDASVAVAYLLPDETSPSLIEWLRGLATQGTPVVPAHWWAEVGNALVIAGRRKRIAEAMATLLLTDMLAFNPVVKESENTQATFEAVHIAQMHQLTVYDALYVQLALDTGLPLVAFDRKMTSAARALNIPVLIAPVKVIS